MIPAGRNPAGYSDRSITAEETFVRVQPYLKHYGVTRLARLTTLDTIGIPVWNAVSPNSKSIVINQGKGISDADARVSACMEAIERAVACAPEVESWLTTANELTSAGRAFDRLDCLIASGHQPLDTDDKALWLAGMDLNSGEPTYVPYDAVTLDRTTGNNRFWQSSDGLSSGNTQSEAILHGILERVERDAVLLSQIRTTRHVAETSVDPASFGDTVVSGLARQLLEARLKLKLFDVTSDVGIPCYTALIGPQGVASGHYIRSIDVAEGAGAHLSPIRAAIRAITEAAQSRLTYISGARDDLTDEIFSQPLVPEIRKRFETPTSTLRDIPAEPLPGGIQASITGVLSRLKAAGIRKVIAVPLSAPEKPFSVVKLLVPELENPDGRRRIRLGARALSKSLSLS